jgi:hypothetical protein
MKEKCKKYKGIYIRLNSFKIKDLYLTLSLVVASRVAQQFFKSCPQQKCVILKI